MVDAIAELIRCISMSLTTYLLIVLFDLYVNLRDA